MNSTGKSEGAGTLRLSFEEIKLGNMNYNPVVLVSLEAVEEKKETLEVADRNTTKQPWWMR